MYVQVKTVDGKTKMLPDISKTMSVLDFKLRIESVLNIKKDKQRLFFRGKQLEEDYSLFDYNINMNDVVQVMEKPDLEKLDKEEKSISESTSEQPSTADEETAPTESLYFKVGDFVDVRDTLHGAWFEGKVVGIVRNKDRASSSTEQETDSSIDDYCYNVLLTGESNPLCNLQLQDVRPRARKILPLSSLQVDDRVMVNYNIEYPKKRGYWYDFQIKEIKLKGKKELVGDLYIGNLTTPMNNCVVIFPNEVMQIEETKPRSTRDEDAEQEPTQRQTGDFTDNELCDRCKINPKRKCTECGCHVCGLKSAPEKQVVCDECNMGFHIWCIRPPMEAIPDIDEWFCNECKNDENEIVKAGEKLKASKKKAKMPSTLNQSNRDWGKGMACVGRTKECTIVPPNHFGPIPGIEVGTQWLFRVQVSESGVHRPPVSGIHGRESDGAYSIVLSGGYEDDVDNGDEFAYTGSGGRDLSGNKRTAMQSCDQVLTRMNKALALNCNAPLDSKKGAEAKDWRGGKPVRVIRNFKLAKHSEYAPKEGNRYDGIYKLVKYYPEKGKSGFIVWRYMFRRDDPIPAPWSKEGKKRIESLGLEMIYPEGYLEAMKAKEKVAEENNEETPKKKKGKRVLEESVKEQSSAKKQKVVKYKLSVEVTKAITKDKINEKLWSLCKENLELGKPKFLSSVEEAFTCICCMELVCKPVTLQCHHNVCFECIKRSFTANIETCPHCREPVKDYKDVNVPLKQALLELFPGYTAGRE